MPADEAYTLTTALRVIERSRHRVLPQLLPANMWYACWTRLLSAQSSCTYDELCVLRQDGGQPINSAAAGSNSGVAGYDAAEEERGGLAWF